MSGFLSWLSMVGAGLVGGGFVLLVSVLVRPVRRSSARAPRRPSAVPRSARQLRSAPAPLPSGAIPPHRPDPATGDSVTFPTVALPQIPHVRTGHAPPMQRGVPPAGIEAVAQPRRARNVRRPRAPRPARPLSQLDTEPQLIVPTVRAAGPAGVTPAAEVPEQKPPRARPKAREARRMGG